MVNTGDDVQQAVHTCDTKEANAVVDLNAGSIPRRTLRMEHRVHSENDTRNLEEKSNDHGMMYRQGEEQSNVVMP